MTTDKQDSRAAFEAWQMNHDNDQTVECYELTDEGVTRLVVDAMWASWQAARERALTEAKSICSEYSMDARVDTKQRIGASHCATQIGAKLC